MHFLIESLLKKKPDWTEVNDELNKALLFTLIMGEHVQLDQLKIDPDLVREKSLQVGNKFQFFKALYM